MTIYELYIANIVLCLNVKKYLSKKLYLSLILKRLAFIDNRRIRTLLIRFIRAKLTIL